MPELELIGDELDAVRVRCAMIYPTNKKLREGLLATYYSIYCEKGAERLGVPVELPRDLLEVFMDMPARQDQLGLAREEAKRGLDAGDILVLVHEMQESGEREPSVNKAVKLRARFLKKHGHRYSDGTVPNSSKSTVEKNRRAFASVAHLWAATAYFGIYQQSEQDVHNLFVRDLPFFLAVAEKYRLFAESFVASRDKSNTSLMQPGAAWALPESYEMPEIEYVPRRDDEEPSWVAQELEKRG